MKAEGDVRVAKAPQLVEASWSLTACLYYEATATAIVGRAGSFKFVQSSGRAETAFANAVASSAAGVTLTPT